VWSYYVIVSYRLYVPQVFFSFFLYYSRRTAWMLLIVCKGFVTKLTRWVPLVEQELLTLPEHQSSPAVFSGVRVTRYLVLCVCFVDRCLSFCTFSFGHCVVCSSSDSDYPFGIFKLFFIECFPLITPGWKKKQQIILQMEWILRLSQPVCDYDRTFLAMTSTCKQRSSLAWVAFVLIIPYRLFPIDLVQLTKNWAEISFFCRFVLRFA
jgi:hypothetical protein